MSHHDLIQFGSMERRGLRFPNHVPAIHPRLRRVSREDPTAIFEAIASGDILLHHPYHDFESSVLHFIESAAMDPDVLAIKISVYRTNKESPIIRALVGASHRGKQVAVLMEVKARFDEAPNIEWGQRLEAEGVHVSYGVQSLKTHAKCALVVRREGKGTRQYAHLGTGNYHSGTAKLYVDLGILTADPEITADVAGLFNTLTGATVMRRFKRIIVAPRSMRRRFIGLIQREAEHAAAGRPSGIWAKMNSLQDPQIIRELYSASAAGVPITLFVRSMCCLRPGVEGLSETIRVVSVVGRFLEHSRIFRFTNGGEAELFFGSADWAKRNLNNRVEVITPVIDERVRAELEAIIDAHGRDNSSAWDIGGDGDHRLRSPASGEPVANVQSFLMSEPLGGVVDPTRREHVQPGHSSGNPRPLPSETES